jgi:hypothetical protein
MDKGKKVGRLAMRVEGEFWVAYYALPDTMEGAIPLGSIRMATVGIPRLAGIPRFKEAFMQLMWELVSDLIAQETGQRPKHYDVEPAPEHEKAKQ